METFVKRRSLIVLLAGSILGVFAIGQATADDGNVQGRVTLDGKPLPSGKITFHAMSGQFVGASIKDGTYSIDRVRPGKYRVTVQGKGVPARYTLEEASALTVEMKEGDARFDFEMASK